MLRPTSTTPLPTSPIVCVCIDTKYEVFAMKKTDWKKATGKDGKLAKHESSNAHKAAEESYRRRREAVNGVDALLSRARQEKLQRLADEKEKNRRNLTCIIDIIRFLARQGIAFRGHDEDDSSSNRGNFLEFVHFIAKYHSPLNEWITTHPGNVSWLSPQIQNELIEVVAAECVGAIAKQCRGRVFSVMCDEVRDRSNTELMSVVVRYINEEAEINEHLIGLIEVAETTAKYLHTKLTCLLKFLQLSTDLLVGQCYDGASNMSGAYNGLQALMKKEGRYNPIYIHCWAHVLNLVLQDVSKSTALCSRTFDLLQKIYVFMEGSTKRHAGYLKACESLHLSNGLLALQSLSGTRWSAKCVNLRIVKRCMPAICACLVEIADSDASGLLTAIKEPTFIFGLEFLCQLFLLCNAASEALQSTDMDLAAAAVAIAELKTAISNIDSDEQFDVIYNASIARCEELGIDPKKPAKRRKHAPAALNNFVMDRYLTTPSDTFTVADDIEEDPLRRRLRVEYFRPVLDVISRALADRFNDDCTRVLQNMPAVFTKTLNAEGIVTLANIFKLDGELCFSEAKSMMFGDDNKPKAQYEDIDSLAAMAKTMRHELHTRIYRNFHNLIIHLLTLPVTSAGCERSHSKVAFVKSAVRSSMTSHRLADLVMISSEKSTIDELDLSHVVDRFALSPRGLPL